MEFDVKKFKVMISVLILTAAVAAVTLQGYAQNAGGKVMIVNGYFFRTLPDALKGEKLPKDIKLFSIGTPEGSKATCIYSPEIVLSEELLKASVPAEEIAEGKELLRRYEEQKENMMGMTFSLKPGKPLVKVGEKFPEFTSTDINGRTWTNADVEGKVMVLNLWFTGCGPCRAEMPELSGWKDEMPDVMFFSSTYEAPEIARQVLDKVRFNWIPLVSDTQFKEFMGSKGYPLTVVIDKSGRIAAFEYGTSPEQRATLKNKIQSLR